MANKTLSLIIYIVSIITGTIIAILIGDYTKETFWISYVFIVLALIFFFLSNIYTTNNKWNDTPTTFSLIPVVTIYVVVTILAVLFGSIVLRMPFFSYFLFQFIIMAVFLSIAVMIVMGSSD